VQAESVFKYNDDGGNENIIIIIMMMIMMMMMIKGDLQKYNFHLLATYENALINRLLVQCI
jgi:hypothetical protein